MSIRINPKYDGHGYCATKQYEDDFLYVSRGGLNEHVFAGEMNRPRLVLIDFTLMDITVIGDTAEHDEFMALLEKNDAGLPGRIHKWALKLLAEHLSAKWFKYIINNAYTKGQKDGRNDIRSRFNTLLQEEL